jgi:small-conductance mechanosensitive channel
MMNISQINTAIIQGTWTNDQLTSIIDAVKFARARLTEQSKRSLRIGDNVNFTSSKTGQNYTGLVTKIAIKFVTVRTAQGLWKVPANMLNKIEDREFA